MTLLMSWTKIYLLIVLPIAYSKVDHEWNAPATITYKECTNTVCKEEAKDIIACMSPHVNPCDDFFEYVCGNWPKQHINPEKLYRSFPWNIESRLEYKAFVDIRSTLEKPIDPHEADYSKRAKMLYQACMNLPWMGRISAADLKPIVASAGPWPMFPQESNSDESNLDWVSVHNYYLKLTGESALFGLAIKLNQIEKKPALEIKKPLSPYGMFIRLATWSVREKEDYITFLNTIANSVKPPNAIHIPSNKLHKYFENVFDFRYKVQKMINSLEKESDTVMTIDYLNYWYNLKSAIHTTTAKIPWLRVIQALYENDMRVHITENTTVLVSHSSYFVGLRSILDKTLSSTINASDCLAKTSIQILVNHIHLYFIERHLLLTRVQEELYYVSRSFFPSVLPSKSRVFPEKWYSCIEKHGMPNTIGKIYVENHSSLMMKEHVHRMVRKIQDMVMIQIDDATWLDEKAKLTSKCKIDKLKMAIGYPQWYDQPSRVQQSECISMLPQQPEAKYCAQKNKIYLTAAYFQPPLYGVFLPFQMNYGGLGSLIGHEIYHSLDSNGLLYNVDGKKIAVWSRDIIASYNLKRKCFMRQYSDYKVKEFQGYSDAPTKPHSFTTVEEDISDTMGLKTAYEVYRLSLLEANHVCSSLPKLSKFSCDQLFFISFARSYCFAAKPREMMIAARYDEHHTPRVRVNGAVSNMKEFSDAFQCAANAPLNPKHRCDLWE